MAYIIATRSAGGQRTGRRGKQMPRQQPKTERRKYPRIAHVLPLKIIANGYDFTTTSQNVSCVGTYCTVDKYIPPFTKLAVTLLLPINNSSRQVKAAITCKGIVVRTEDSSDGRFNIAIFFNDINAAERNKISQYISQFLS